MKENLKTGGASASDSDSTALQSLKDVACSTPRALTESEIELLRQFKREAPGFPRIKRHPLIRKLYMLNVTQ